MRPRVSVAMAVYNSERYIHDQIDSILSQLTECDELIISYNESNDDTWEIINEYQTNVKIVKVVTCEEKSVQANFNNAILNTKGKYIFLADHDDIWLDNKVETVLRGFEDNNTMIVMHSRIVTDEKLKPVRTVSFNKDSFSTNFLNNFIANRYNGASMAFRKELVPLICPLPLKTVYHDVWIGLIGSLYGKVKLIDEPLMLYRRHQLNESSETSRDLKTIIKDRIVLLIRIIQRISVIKKIK